MRLSLRSVICCCVFTTVLPPVQGETEEPNVQIKRLSEWLQSCLKSQQNISLETVTEPKSDVLVEPLKKEDGETPTLPSSCEENIRSKRSPSKQSGCILSTCTIQIMGDRLDKIDTKQKLPCVSIRKLEMLGRRRRSLADISLLTLLTGSKKAGQQS